MKTSTCELLALPISVVTVGRFSRITSGPWVQVVKPKCIVLSHPGNSAANAGKQGRPAMRNLFGDQEFAVYVTRPASSRART